MCSTYLSKTVHMGDVQVIYNTDAQYQELSVSMLSPALSSSRAGRESLCLESCRSNSTGQ